MSSPLRTTFDIGVVIDNNHHWLGRELTDLGHEALSAFEERAYHTAALRAAVWLERAMKQMLQEWGTPPPDPRATLGQLVGAVRNSGRAPESVTNRLGDANAIRIRAAHDVAGDGSAEADLLRVTPGDSFQILSVMGLVAEWHGRSHPPPQPPPDALPVFLSIGYPHRLEQLCFLRCLHHEMQRLGVALRSLRSDDYSPDAPFDQIADLLRHCRAALVVGLDRAHSYAVFEKEKSDKQTHVLDRYSSTTWNQIEGSMAAALRLPILILRERRLHTDGIFEAKHHRHKIHDFDLHAESKSLSPELSRFLGGWVQSVRNSPKPGSPAPLDF